MKTKTGCISNIFLLLGIVVLFAGCGKSSSGYLTRLEQYSADLKNFDQRLNNNNGQISLHDIREIEDQCDKLNQYGNEVAGQHLVLSDSERTRFDELKKKVSPLLPSFPDNPKIKDDLTPKYPW